MNVKELCIHLFGDRGNEYAEKLIQETINETTEKLQAEIRDLQYEIQEKRIRIIE